MIPDWEKEQEQLQQEHKRLYEEYKPLREKLNEMFNVKYCVEYATKKEKERTIQAAMNSMIR